MTNEDAIKIYQGDAFTDINRYYRTGQKTQYKEYTDILEQIENKSFTFDMLYKGYDSLYTILLCNKYQISNPSDINELKEKLIGKVITDKAFNSTTRRLDLAMLYCNKYTPVSAKKYKPILLYIEGRKVGIDIIEYLNNVKTLEECEFILKRNSKIKITDVTFDVHNMYIVIHGKIQN